MMENNNIRPVITIRAAREKVFWGPGVMMILEALDAAGAMKDACRKTGISYSKAWRILNNAEAQLGYALVVRQHGGSSGGGCMITREGREIMRRYQEASERIRSYSEGVFAEVFAPMTRKPDQVDKLYEALHVCNGDIVTLTGAGGKTSCLYRLGEELKEKSVLLTTTTKMKYPDDTQTDYIYEAEAAIQAGAPGRTFLYGKRLEDGKCAAVSEKVLEQQSAHYAVTLIEADGSRGMPLKGYREYEPCIPVFATLNVGIVTLNGLGQYAREPEVPRAEVFLRMAQMSENEPVKAINLARWIAHPDGMFKGAAGRLVLYFNQIEHEEQLEQVKQVMACLEPVFMNRLTRITAGSVRQSRYWILGGG